MDRNITFKGNPLTLVGRNLRIPCLAPDFKVISQDLKEISLADFKDRIKIINSFPSLDTPVCDLQVKEFNKRATGLSGDVVIIGISKDLPFAQKRFCEAFEIKNVFVFSDYKTSSFGINYGLLIKELNLLARAALIVDKNNTLRYLQLSPELTAPLNYEDVLKNLEEVIKSPVLSIKEGLPSKCKPCETGAPALPKESIEKLLANHQGWQLVEDKKLVKEFKFRDFIESKYFLDMVSVIAEEQGHHPTMTLIYNKLKITLTTHAAGGLTENDFIMAMMIDEL
ncbi:MAG: thiol peroxidase [Candidatus Omnitrophica bacterium]|nr:thiol peroxidase [Candidatus Omnitrophota bacterium]